MENENDCEIAAPRIRVVVVDDSSDVRYLLATILEKDGRFEVVGEACDAAEAITVVAVVQPELVLVDLQLDGPDGTWLISELRNAGVDAALAVVTGSALQREHDAAMAAGADSVHGKMSMTTTMTDDLAAIVARRAATVSA